ncbi:MAG: GMC family oxidoreductase [Baekduia sp.]
MTLIDGRTIDRQLELRCDVVVVGSGPAGSAFAAEASAQGLSVVVVEEGPWFTPEEAPPSGFTAMSGWYRQMGASIVAGRTPMPYVQGRMVGGSSPINGAICWRLPRDVHDQWLDADPGLDECLSWESVEAATDRIEQRLSVAPTDPSVAGPKNLLMAKGAEALGIEHRPIRRNTSGCRGLGRCIQGCPEGHKLSADRTVLADAISTGTTVLSSVTVNRVVHKQGRATAVAARAASGAPVSISASEAVVLAASAVQTPALLLASGITQGPVGRHFQGHPGVAMAGRFAESVRAWEGATQGHEVIGLRREGLKFEALGFGLDVLASRMPGTGAGFAARLRDLAHQVEWGAAVKARAEGRVVLVRGTPVVRYEPAADDLRLFRRGLRVLGELLFAAGAESVEPGVRGFPAEIRDASELAALEHDGPRSPAAFSAAVTHMFGATRIGSDPRTSVVSPRFEHHNVARLFVCDSSVFPSNTGVNPQIAIMAVAQLCARHVAGVPSTTKAATR